MKNVLSFLSDLEANNNREWFAEHKKSYEAALDEVKSLTKVVEDGLNKVDVIEEAKIFRIYRDVRFSQDKSPYKNNFGIGFKREGKMRRGGFYLHLQPNESFVGGGFWQPEPHDLKRIRDEFAADAETIKPIINDPKFIQYFKELGGDALSRPPKGYDANLPAIDLVKKKNYLLMRKVSNTEVMDPKFANLVVDTFTAMLPFFDYMSSVLTTNLDGELIV
jgi:uncharacterized protein (TIGR02453 family)